MAAGTFAGFSPDLFAFLKHLKANNNKGWFDGHRDVYEEHVKAPLGDFVETLAAAFANDGIPLTGDRKTSLFRLNRDVRFAKDKSPYKTNAGGMLTLSGDKKDPGMLYLHFEPAASFIAAGFYMPEPPVLHALRSGIAAKPKEFAKVVAALKKKDLNLEAEYTLKRPPKGFDTVSDPAAMAWVKLTSHVVSRKLADDEVLAAGFLKHVKSFAKNALPLLQFGAEAMKS